MKTLPICSISGVFGVGTVPAGPWPLVGLSCHTLHAYSSLGFLIS